MENHEKVCTRITLAMDRAFSKEVVAAAAHIGLPGLNSEVGRSVILKSGAGTRRFFSTKQAFVEDPIQIFSFLVLPSQAEEVMRFFTDRLRLAMPGRGNLYAERVRIPASIPPLTVPELQVPEGPDQMMAEGLVGIRCITQLDEGNTVAGIGLSTGTAVPAITYGTGTGLRNRLGLWRVLIPAEKEITTLVVDASHAETVMDMMISAGALDQPGRGFICSFPVSMGVLNTRFSAGSTSQAASIEQIVSAIDEIRGSTAWRKKSFRTGGGAVVSRTFLTERINFSMICNEGFGESLTGAAMAAGAGGATLSLLRHMSLGLSSGSVSPAREISVMTIGRGQEKAVLEAVDRAGLFGREASGEVQIAEVFKAFTYTG